MPIPVNVLVIDDEEVMRDSCRQILARHGYCVKLAGDGRSAMKMVREEMFDLVILDLKLPGMPGMEILKKIKEESSDIIVIIITGQPTISSAVEAMKAGAYDFLPKPFTPDEMLSILGRAGEKRRLMAENVYLRQELISSSDEQIVIGPNARMGEMYEVISKVAPTDTTVLITGESGTGKELVARAIHRASSRKEGPFITVDCGSLVPTLFESELFGHEKGSFTDAIASRRGKLELANGGTIFFDEIGNISIEAQSRLLRVIQEREITKVGGTRTIKIDVRIIAATNIDLKKAVEEGKFRDDLYYRINVISVRLPPLRERKDDIEKLVRHFIEKYNRKRKKNISSVSENAIKLLLSYYWPGNIRELENAMERAVILADGDVIRSRDLPMHDMPPPPNVSAGLHERKVRRTLADAERNHIMETLAKFAGNKTKTAEYLDIDRKTLHLKIKAYNMDTAT